MLEIIAAVISMFVTAFVTMKLWAWLVVPIFGVAALTLAQAIALRIVIFYVLPVPNVFHDIYMTDKITKLPENEKILAKLLI